MNVFSERPRDMRGSQPQDTFDFGESQRMASRRRAATASPQRRAAPLDMGTVGVALSGMAFYWLMPALMSSRSRRRRRRPSNGDGRSQDSR